MRRAIELSLQNVHSGNGGPFGALVVKDDEIVGEGANQVLATNDPSAHAEVIAIRAACRKLKSFQLTGCEIYSSCEPCPMCLAAIYWARPSKVFFGNSKEDAAAAGFDDSFIYKEIALAGERRKIPLVQLMRGEAIRAFQEWAKSAMKVEY